MSRSFPLRRPNFEHDVGQTFLLLSGSFFASPLQKLPTPLPYLSRSPHDARVMSSALARPVPTAVAAARRQAPRAAAVPLAAASSSSKSVRFCHHRPRLVAVSPSSSRPLPLLPSQRASKTLSVVRSVPADEHTEVKATSSSSEEKHEGESDEGNKPTTTTPPMPTPQPPQLPRISLLRRLATELAAAFVRAVRILASLLGGREFGRRAAALLAGALFVAVAVGGAAAGRAARSSLFDGAARAPHAISASSSSSSSPPPSLRAAARGKKSAAPSPSAASAPGSSRRSPAAAVAAVRAVPAAEVPYSQFLRLVASGSVGAARLEPGRVVFDVVVGRPSVSSSGSSSSSSSSSSSRRLFGLLPRRMQQEVQKPVFALSSSRRPQTLATARLPGDSATLVPLLQANGVEFAAAGEDPGAVAARVLAQCLMLWLPLAPLLLLMSRAVSGRGGGGGAGAGGFGSRGRGRGGVRGGGRGGGGLGGGAQR